MLVDAACVLDNLRLEVAPRSSMAYSRITVMQHVTTQSQKIKDVLIRRADPMSNCVL